MEVRKTRRTVVRYLAGGLALAGLRSGMMWAQEPGSLPASLTSGIESLKAGAYLWAPMIAPSGPVLAIISFSVQRCYVYRNGVLVGVTTI